MDYTEYEDSYDSETENSEQQEINNICQESSSSGEIVEFNEYEDSEDDVPDLFINMIEATPAAEATIGLLQAEAELPQVWDDTQTTRKVSDARLMLSRPAAGRAHTIGHHCLTRVKVTLLKKEYTVDLLLDSGAACSVVGSKYLNEFYPDWKTKLLPCSNTKFSGCGSKLFPIGVIQLPMVFPHNQGSIRIQPEFVVMENADTKYFILGSEFLSLYGIDIHHSKEKYFTIGNDNKKKKFALDSSKSILPVYRDEEKAPVKPRPDQGYVIEEGIKEAGFGPRLSPEQRTEVEKLIRKYPDQFGLGDQVLGKIDKHPVQVTLNIEKPYPPILRKAP